MRSKKVFKTVSLSLAAIALACAAVLFLANAKDTDLHPEVSGKLSNAEPPSPDEERASRLVSELKIPSDQEPKFCSSSDWCPKSEILKPDFSDYLERHKSPLTAFNQLISLPYYFVEPKNFGRGIFDFLKLANLKRREWNLRLAKSSNTFVAKSIAEEMRNLNRFLTASLGRPQTIIEAQVFLLALKGNRNFLMEAARAEPTLRTAFEKYDFHQIMAGASELEFTKVASTVHVGELRVVAMLLQENLTYNGMMLTEIDAHSDGPPDFWTRALDKFVQAGFLRNETLNRQSEMLEKAIAKIKSGGEGAPEPQPHRSVSLSPRNFIGRNIVSVLSSNLDRNFYRMKQMIATLSKPVSFEATPN